MSKLDEKLEDWIAWAYEKKEELSEINWKEEARKRWHRINWYRWKNRGKSFAKFAFVAGVSYKIITYMSAKYQEADENNYRMEQRLSQMAPHEKERMMYNFKKRILSKGGRLNDAVKEALRETGLSNHFIFDYYETPAACYVTSTGRGYIDRCEKTETYYTYSTDSDGKRTRQTHTRTVYDPAAGEMVRKEIRDNVKEYEEKQRAMTPENPYQSSRAPRRGPQPVRVKYPLGRGRRKDDDLWENDSQLSWLKSNDWQQG